MKDNAKLVYSTDPKLNEKCSKCRELKVNCTCLKEDDATLFKGEVVLRIEKNARGGKIVTLIERLPRNESYLKNLCTILKKKSGSGGTFYMAEKGGVVEIQGDKKDLLRTLLEKEKIKVKN